MQTRRFDFNWSPLVISRTIITDKSVPDKQTYDINTGIFTPDYTLTPLMVSPFVSIIDRDGYLTNGDVTSQITNIKWYEVVNGVKKEILEGNTGYKIFRGNEHHGAILVKKNALPSSPITLQLYAEFIDKRTRQINSIIGSKIIKSREEEKDSKVTVDAPAQTLYDPLTDPSFQTINAKVWVGDSTIPSSKFTIVWKYSTGDNVWHDIKDNVAIENKNTSIIVDREKMGDELNIRCVVSIRNQESQKTKQLETIFSIIRRIPKYEFEIDETPNNINHDIKTIHPTVTITNAKGVIDDIKNVLMPIWYVAKNDPVELVFKEVAYGKHPEISTDIMDIENGMILAVDVVDRGSLKIAVDPVSGAEYVDSDGKIFFIN